MRKYSIYLTLALSCAFLFACSDAGQPDQEEAVQPTEEAQSSSGVAVPGAHAEAVAAEAVAEVPTAASDAGSEAAQPCLALVAAGKLEEALPSCLAALKADPNNPQLAKAVADTKAGIASQEANAVAAAVTSAQGAAENTRSGNGE